MKIFDLAAAAAFPYEQREKNVFYQTKEFKTRIIELPPGGQMPVCEMASHVIFFVLDGEATVTVNSGTVTLKEKQCLITEPATLSMKTMSGVRILGVQIAKTIEIL
jgi:mannose-6-phosphate isomerase-like protein (cupin superfamily)